MDLFDRSIFDCAIFDAPCDEVAQVTGDAIWEAIRPKHAVLQPQGFCVPIVFGIPTIRLRQSRRLASDQALILSGDL